jgi:hypothetical protein
VKKLARASAWAATSAMLVLCVEATQRGWLWTWIWVALAFMVVLNAIGVIASIAELRAEGRYGGFWPKGSGLSGLGRDDDGPAGEAVHRWRALVTVSRLMPRSAGRRWLAEAESLLAEITDARRQAAIRSYLLPAPRLAMMMWARVVLRWARPGPRRPG